MASLIKIVGEANSSVVEFTPDEAEELAVVGRWFEFV
jgi:hypothetical protein